MKESLPSVFGPDGRVVTMGLDAKVDPHLYPLAQMDELPDWF